ncbi:MAG: RICIN domain-containing protein [Coriobacteriia bacterium]|nr:RICIN domain-containing protein [Coriobacteriia bacterium]
MKKPNKRHISKSSSAFVRLASLLIAFTLGFSNLGIVFADDPEAAATEPGDTGEGLTDDQQVDESLPNDNEDSAEASLDTGTLEPTLDDSAIEPMASTYPYYVVYEPEQNSTIVNVILPNLDMLTLLGSADSVTIEASMVYKGATTRSPKASMGLADLLDAGTDSFTMDFGDFGRYSVTASFYRGETLVALGDTTTVGVTADEYNIAPVSATLPVLYLSLALFGPESIRYSGPNSTGSLVPTILLLERPSHFDWSHLPEGVYGLPYLSQSETVYQPDDFGQAGQKFMGLAPAMVDYVADLYLMNPASVFNLYVVDYYLGLIQMIIYANGIPASQYTITVLSDGAFSYNRFNTVYESEDPGATHAAMVAEWNAAKSAAYASHTVSSGFSLNQCHAYLYVAVDVEANAVWWLARPALFSSGDSDSFADTVRANPKVKAYVISNTDPATPGRLQLFSSADQIMFMRLFDFSGSYFSEAEDSGKQIMVFLGTTIWLEEGHFSDYARFTMAFYGDDYAYYYKGHPGTPTGMYPDKQAELDTLGIIDVDSSIPAELILFFYPQILLSGYSSSTYASVPVGMGKLMFNMSKASGENSPLYKNMDAWITSVTPTTPQAIRSLCVPGDNNYLVEFSDAFVNSVNNEYTHAIWDATAYTITYYLFDGTSYSFVRTEDAHINALGEGLFVISPKVNALLAVDVVGGSLSNEALIQAWTNNQSPAQTFRLTAVGSGYYTIQNVKSGKMLDAQYGGQTPGTMVHQWTPNGTPAQKWKLVDTGDGDGSFYIICASNGLYLDMQWGGSQAGTYLHLWNGNNSTAQKFYFDRLTENVASGTYNIVSLVSGPDIDMVMDVQGGSLSNGGVIQLWHSNETPAQQFELRYNPANGYYSIINVKSGLYLDVAGANPASESTVQQFQGNGTPAQMWRIRQNSDGSYTFISATGRGTALDVQGANNADGARIWTFTPNDTPAQKWGLVLLP